MLLGADPLADFPDRELAARALARRADVDLRSATHRDASARSAAVVLPVAGDGERAGTTTNLEGRVSRLPQKVVPPGVAWPAWMVANELALRLGGEFGWDGVDPITEEIARLAPATAASTPALFARPAARDGLLLPLTRRTGASRPPPSIRWRRRASPPSRPGGAAAGRQRPPGGRGSRDGAAPGAGAPPALRLARPADPAVAPRARRVHLPPRRAPHALRPRHVGQRQPLSRRAAPGPSAPRASRRACSPRRRRGRATARPLGAGRARRARPADERSAAASSRLVANRAIRRAGRASTSSTTASSRPASGWRPSDGRSALRPRRRLGGASSSWS